MHGQILFLTTALSMTGLLAGQAVPEAALTLDECIAEALERHPLILASSDREQAAEARVRQAKVYPIPSVDFNSDIQPHFLDFVNSEEAYLGVSQTFELPRKRKARGRIAEQESRELEMDTELIKIEVIFLVRRAFYELLLAQEKLAYAEQDQKLAEDYLEQAELKLAAGDVARVEVSRARVEALTAANAVRAAASEVSLAEVRLNYHLARRERSPVRIVGQLQMPFAELNLPELQTEALQLRPEVARLRLSIEKESLVQDNARLRNLPDPGVNMSAHYLENLPWSWSFTVSVPLPFLFQQSQKAEIAESQANARALQREAEQARNTVFVEVEEACTSARQAQEQILLFQNEILPQAEEVLEMFTFSYQEGEIGGIELIQARRTLNESRRSYADTLFGYAEARAALDMAVGRRP